LWISDSHIAVKALNENLARNNLCEPKETNSPVQIQDCTTSILTPLDVVLIKIPRTLALLEHQLLLLRPVIQAHTQIIAAGKINLFSRNLMAMFERLIGTTTTSLAKKKSRLLFCQPDLNRCSEPVKHPYPTCWNMPGPKGANLVIANHANVFSRQSLDIGARFMLEHLRVAPHEQVIDLGCGNGVLGLSALLREKTVKLTFVDESYMALASAQQNVKHNAPQRLADCRFVASNCLEELLASDAKQQGITRVLCNPPFHQQSTITDHIAWQMFHDSHQILKPAGELWVVCNRHLPYHSQLKRCFGGASVVAANAKFVIFRAIKR
jgi:23S rRNA (guanine1835-N2)-methyltransferase